MEALAPEVAAEMRARAQAVRDRQATGSFTLSWKLTGEKSICKPGGSEIVRLMPRWDYAQSLITVDGQRVPNPDYKPRVPFLRAFEHWYEDANGKKTRSYCPRLSGNPTFRCTVCLSSQALAQGTKEDKKAGKDMAAREVFIFNALIGDPRRVNDEKLADIRPISCPGTIYNDIETIMNGGDKPQFARGNVMSPAQGYDLQFNRPAGKTTGERWSVDCATESSPMYTKAQAVAFKGWVTRLVNLEEMVAKELLSEESLFKSYYGRDPEAGEMDKIFGAARSPKGVVVPQGEATAPAGVESAEEVTTAADVTEPDDDFVKLMPPAGQGKPAGRAPRR